MRYENVGVLLDAAQGLFAGGRLDGLIAAAAQIDDYKTANAGFVFEHQNLFHNLSFPFGFV